MACELAHVAPSGVAPITFDAIIITKHATELCIIFNPVVGMDCCVVMIPARGKIHFILAARASCLLRIDMASPIFPLESAWN